MTLEGWLMEIAGHYRAAGSIAHLQTTNPPEWGRQFEAWIDSHDPNTPVLSDEAMSCESINQADAGTRR